MTEEHMLSFVSFAITGDGGSTFLSGKTHGGIMNILIQEMPAEKSLRNFQKLAKEWRLENERLHYPTCVPELTE
jgi:hypothetical protein